MTHKILVANEQQPIRQAGGNYRRWVQSVVHQRTAGQYRVVWETRGHIVRAWVNRGSWVVSCPHCPGSQVAQPGEPFFCVDCLMAGNQGYAMKVWFPMQRKTIEAILMRRPDPLTRNYLLGETVDDLRAENIEHGHRTDLDTGAPLLLLPKSPRKPPGIVVARKMRKQ